MWGPLVFLFSQVSSIGKDLGYDAAEVANALGLEPQGVDGA